MSRIELNVPYAEKDAAKALGAKWDARRKTWYVTSLSVLNDNPGLSRWAPAEQIAPPARATDDARRKLTVTQLAQLGRCEQQMVFDRRYGVRRSKVWDQKGRAGQQAHRRREYAVALGAKPKASPCFIATACFGDDAIETSILRQFRDGRLRRTRTGRWIVARYYRLSPPIARFLLRHPGARAVMRVCLRCVVAWLARRAQTRAG